MTWLQFQQEARIWIINYVVKNSKWTDGKLIVPKESVEHFWFSAFDNELEVKQINNS